MCTRFIVNPLISIHVKDNKLNGCLFGCLLLSLCFPFLHQFHHNCWNDARDLPQNRTTYISRATLQQNITWEFMPNREIIPNHFRVRWNLLHFPNPENFKVVSKRKWHEWRFHGKLYTLPSFSFHHYFDYFIVHWLENYVF